MVSCPNFNFTIEVCGTKVAIHWLWIVFYALTILGSFSFGPLFALLLMIVEGPILLVTIIIYMVGIAMMTKAVGGTVEGVVIFPFWGFTKYGLPYHDKGPSGDLRIAIAGPLTCIVQGAVWFGLFYLAAKGDMFYFNYMLYLNLLKENFFAVLFCEAVFLNIVLFVLNMLPAYPLAGGRVLAAVMLMRKVDRPRVALITGKCGLFVAFWGCMYGIFAFIFWKNAGSYAVFVFVLCAVVAWYSTALIRRSAEGNVDTHELFLSSTQNANNVNAAAVAVPTATAAAVETGQASNTGEPDKKKWWQIGGKKKKAEEGTKNKEPEVDYGF